MILHFGKSIKSELCTYERTVSKSCPGCGSVGQSWCAGTLFPPTMTSADNMHSCHGATGWESGRSHVLDCVFSPLVIQRNWYSRFHNYQDDCRTPGCKEATFVDLFTAVLQRHLRLSKPSDFKPHGLVYDATSIRTLCRTPAE